MTIPIFAILDDFYLLLALFYSVFCMILAYAVKDESQLDEYLNVMKSSLNSTPYKYSLVMELSISVFMLLDLIVEHVWVGSQTKMSTTTTISCLVICYMFASAASEFLYVIPNVDLIQLHSIHNGRLVLMGCSTLCIAREYGGSIWHSKYLKISAIIGAIACTLRIFRSSHNYEFVIMDTIGYTIQVLCTCVILLCGLKWLWSIRQKLIPDLMSQEEWHCTVYIALFTICVFAMWIVHGYSLPRQDNHHATITYLISYEIIFAVFVVVQGIYLSRTFRRKSVKQEEELEFKRMFVRYISHEVRTPLNTAIIGLQVLTEELARIIGNEDNMETVRDVKSSCEVAVNVLNELLTFDKLEGGNLLLERSLVKPWDLVDSTVRPFYLQAKKKKIILQLYPSATGINEPFLNNEPNLLGKVMIDVDKNKVGQVVRNLVSNALKFTPKGGTVKIRLSIFNEESTTFVKPNQMLRIDVEDTGAGISAENQKRLFKEIIQFNPGKLQKGGGSGLGLYISHGIVRLHGGNLTAYSAGEGHGSTFTIVLPTAVARPKRGSLGSLFSLHKQSSHRSSASLVSFRVPAANRAISSRVAHSSRVAVDMEYLAVDKSSAVFSALESGTTHRSQDVESKTTNTHGRKTFEEKNSSAADERVRSYADDPASLEEGLRANTSLRGLLALKSFDGNVEDKITGLRDLNLRILVVDDSVISRKMQCKLLKRRCRNWLEAEEGQEAVDVVKSSLNSGKVEDEIDLILMDSNMPSLSGPEATKIIRDLGYKGAVVGVTGNIATDDVENFLASGADVILSKPLDIDKFDATVIQLFKGTVPMPKYLNEKDDSGE